MDRRLWRAGLGLMASALAVSLALIVALAMGWNDPHPARVPDWQASGAMGAIFPIRLSASSNHTAVRILGWPGNDFTLEGEALPLSGPDFNGYGLVYRAQDPTHYAVFAVGGDGYYAVLRLAGDEETALVEWQQFPHVRRGRQPNRLRITCVGSTCRFYINDEFATALEGNAHLPGDVGLWARTFGEEDVTVEFLNLRGWIDALDRGPDERPW